MAITKPTVGASGWNTAVDAVIDAVNGTTSDIKELARDTLGTALVQGQDVRITVSDPSDTITVDAVTDYGPVDQGFLGWSIDPAYATNSTAVTAGVLYVAKTKVVLAGTSTKAFLFAATGGTSPTNCFVGLFDSTGSRIAVTANQASNWGTAGVKNPSWSSSVAVTPGVYYVGILVGGGTPPAFARAASQGTGANGVGNVGLGAPGFRFGTIGTGQTAMPSSITLSSVAGDNTAFFGAIST